jgi:hypothetical protein
MVGARSGHAVRKGKRGAGNRRARDFPDDEQQSRGQSILLHDIVTL